MFTIEGLKSGTSYRVSVSPVIDGKPGTEVSLNFNTVPGGPEDFTVLNYLGNSAEISWTTSTGSIYYIIEVFEWINGSIQTPSDPKTEQTSELALNVMELLRNISYEFQLRACDAELCSDPMSIQIHPVCETYNPCHANADCVTMEFGVDCSCRDTFAGNGVCCSPTFSEESVCDVSLVSTHCSPTNCTESQRDSFSIGYQCSPCVVPVEADECNLYPDRTTCNNVNYCAIFNISNLCGELGTEQVSCRDTLNGVTTSFTCSCPDGFSLDSQGKCLEVSTTGSGLILAWIIIGTVIFLLLIALAVYKVRRRKERYNVSI